MTERQATTGTSLRARLVVACLVPLSLCSLLAGCTGSDTSVAGAAPVTAIPSVRTTPTPVPTARPLGQQLRPAPVPTSRTTLRPAPKLAEPLRLRVPSVDLDVPVAPAGVDKNGAMELPETVDEAAWYRFGPAPGADEGSAVLAGHIDSFAEGIGPFVELQRLRRGAIVTVTTTAGDRSFRVTDVKRVSKRAVPLGSIFERTGPSRLILMTCAGAYDRARGGYQDNLIVTALPHRS